MMRGGGAEATRLGTAPAGLAAILAIACDNAGPSSRWWVAAFRPHPAALPAARMAATADAVISGRRLRPLRARAGADSGGGSIADWAAVTPASSSAEVRPRRRGLCTARLCAV